MNQHRHMINEMQHKTFTSAQQTSERLLLCGLVAKPMQRGEECVRPKRREKKATATLEMQFGHSFNL